MMEKKTRILAASDIHGDVRAVKRLVAKAKREKVDAVVLCGDITFFNMEVDGLFKPFADAGLYVLLIPGNHEPISTTDFFARAYEGTVKHLHGYSTKIGDVGFFGCAATQLGFCAEDDKTIENMLEKAHNSLEGLSKKVMVVHEPPHGTTLDNIGFHAGSRAVRNMIEKLQPTLALCGHLHETFEQEEIIGTTRVINAGPRGIVIEV
ncbi:hypothetical protein COT72_00520 [archaeon CG10_big_fil_rev_8_21_14_0_10_43_11]|nr:MAG: hypothetical protein COT72_00520 [archaeon CG10_big_fil_rev_8_21_14_0_10_43_11]